MSVIAVCDWCKRPDTCDFVAGLCLCYPCQDSHEDIFGDDINDEDYYGDDDEPI